MNRLINSFKEIFRYKKTEDKFKKIVFFSEDNNYSFFFKGLIDELLKKKIPISIITHDKNDIFHNYNDKNLAIFKIENFFLLQYFFSNIKCENFIMTTTDLGNGIINKSKFAKNYIYIFHSLISTTVAYKKNAFKNYDIFFVLPKLILKSLQIYSQSNQMLRFF
jgi:hypothetical protein